MQNYPFHGEYRAQCLNVVDGDTVDLLVDCGHHNYCINRYRITKINTDELNSPVEATRDHAEAALNQVREWIKPVPTAERMMSLDVWPLRIVTKKNPDGFGRWLADIFFMQDGKEVNVGDELLRLGLAKPYKK